MKFTISYTLLFLYVIAAIVFWGYSLTKQANVVYALEVSMLQKKKSEITPQTYDLELKKIEEKKERRRKQYLGEGSTFLLITIFASALIYIAYYRQRKLSKVQQNFMMSITHELKTPIAGIKLNMQTMERHQVEEAVRRQLVESTIAESNRLNDLCNNILVATQLEDTRHAIYTDEINLRELASAVADEFRKRYPELVLTETYPEQDFVFKGEQTLWKLVLSNLVENARKYSSSPAKIDIQVVQEGSVFRLCIKDEGVGIPDEEKKHIFKKFYRIGNENVRKTKGTGLGLFLVKKIVELYKYDITVKNNTPKGSIFEVTYS